MNFPTDTRSVLIVVVQPGCPACEDFEPRFEHYRRQYAAACRERRVEVRKMNAADQRQLEALQRFQVTVTPTMLVLRRPSGMLKFEGALENAAIDYAFRCALS